MIFHVYLILNNINGKLYVGKTNDPQGRWNKHVNIAKNINNSQSIREQAYPIHHAIRKYGEENFSFRVIESVAEEATALDLEARWISRFRNDGYRLYNLTAGGDSPPRILGEENCHSILTNDQVIEIKFLLSYGRSQSIIAEQFGVSRNTIASISNEDNWAHLIVSRSKIEWLKEKYLSEISLEEKFANEISERKSNAQRGKEPWNKGKIGVQKNFWRKFSDEEILEIYEYYLVCGKYKPTARRFQCSPTTVKKIVGKFRS